MRTYLLLLTFLLLAGFACSQDQPPQTQQAAQTPTQVQTQKPEFQQKEMINHINSGFYIKFGGSIPMGEFANQHNNIYHYQNGRDTVKFNQAKFGGALEFGFLIYLGPAFAHNHLRAGIDATFFAISFNPTDQTLPPNTSASKKMDYWYYFGGQKFGPLLTINPIDHLMIDLSYKINASASWYNSMWGMNLALNEVSLGIRYRVILFAFQYNWGKMKYTYNYDDNPKYQVDVTTMRVLIGFKF
jgi:hypothetical protein